MLDCTLNVLKIAYFIQSDLLLFIRIHVCEFNGVACHRLQAPISFLLESNYQILHTRAIKINVFPWRTLHYDKHTHTHTHDPRKSHSRTRHAEIEGAGHVRVDTCNLFFNLYQPPATLSGGMVFCEINHTLFATACPRR